MEHHEPVIPLPNPGEGGPVYDGGGAEPVIPLPNPGEGGPVYDGGGAEPVIPLPNPGEGGPVYDGGASLPVIPSPGPVLPQPVQRRTSVRFLHAAYGYDPFLVRLDNTRVVRSLAFGVLTPYRQTAAGYHTVTLSGSDGYIYLQKTLPFPAGTPMTVAVINTASGLDLLPIVDSCCPPAGGFGAIRVSNLARNTQPLDVVLPDGRVVYADVRFKETTAYKRIRPGRYQLIFADTDRTPMPAWLDVETLDSAFLGVNPEPDTLDTLQLTVGAGLNYTVFLLTAAPVSGAIQTLVAADG